jgi:tellurite resistance protein TerC
MTEIGFPIETILIFFGVVSLSVYFDLAAHRRSPEITPANAAKWVGFWVVLALLFYVYLRQKFGAQPANLYLAGYALEQTLSIDNLMVFMAIFASFGINGPLQHRILYLGIIGAIFFRALFVWIGTELFAASPWVGFLFAAFVAWTGVKMLQGGTAERSITDYGNHWSVKLMGRLFPVYTRLHGDSLFVRPSSVEREGGQHTHRGPLYATPAFLCLVAIEMADLAFAFDSVPAVIAVTQEPLLVYAAMIFAILGLRSLYFALAALTRYLVHLEKAVIALLFFIAGKMVLTSWNHAVGHTGIHVSPTASLAIVLGVLALGVIASLVAPRDRDGRGEGAGVECGGKREKKEVARDAGGRR